MSYESERSIIERALALGWKGELPSVAGGYHWEQMLKFAREYLETAPDPAPRAADEDGKYLAGRSRQREDWRSRGD